MGGTVDRNVSLVTKDNKGIPCSCRNSECEMFNHKLNRPRRENSLGICRTCGMQVVALSNTRLNLKMEKARKEYEELNPSC